MRHHAATAVVVAVAAAACGRRSSRPPAPPSIAGYVVVAGDAWVRVAASATAPGATRGGGDPISLEVIADHGAFVEVATIPGEEHCHDAPGLAAYRLRLFVARDDLHPVVASPVSIRYPDGTWAELGVGLAVAPSTDHDAEGRLIVAARAGGAIARVAAPVDAIARSYARAAHGGREPAADHVSIDGPVVRLGLGGDPRLGIDLGGDAAVPAVLGDRDDFLEVRARCAALGVTFPADLGVTVDGGRAGGARGGSLPVLPAGTPLTWRDGAAAGVVADDVPLFDDAEALDDGRSCIPVSIGAWWEDLPAAVPLTVCARADAIRDGS
jgi:hypothetical protein